jgi:hypothetical protein
MTGLRRWLPWAVLALTLVPLAWWMFGPRGVAVTLERRSWRFEIEVERLRLESGSDWCDEMPAGARDVIRRTLADPSGRRPAPAEHCRYTTLAWRTQWLARQQGEAGTPPSWPQPPLAVAEPGQPGSERLGRREAFYEVTLRASTGQVWTCRLQPEAWQALRPGQRFRLPVDRWGTASCAFLG